jgi:hypothetical protein
MDRDGIGGFRTIPAGSGTAEQTDLVLFPNVIAHWGLGEPSGTRYDLAGTYLDDSGQFPLTDSTGIASTAGPIGRAALFVRSNSDHLSGGPITLGAGGTTICFWVKLTSKTNYQQLVHIGSASGQPGFAIYTGVTGQIIAEAIEDSTPTYASVTLNSAISDESVWHFVCVWFDPADGKIHAYHNSAVYGPNTGSSSGTITEVPAGSYPVTLGFGIGTTYYLDGAMSDVTIFSEVLSSTDITWLYNSGAGRVFPYPYDGTFRDSNVRKAGNYGYGLARSADSDFGTWSPVGTWGVLREIPEHFPMGAPFGIPRRLYSDTANTRVEYFRLGKDLDENQVEVPDRFAKYVEYYAQGKALEREGPGQDMKLSQHFMGRFFEGVDRMVKRLSENKRSRVSAIGSPGKGPVRPALARLPYRYGHATRRGY